MARMRTANALNWLGVVLLSAVLVFAYVQAAQSQAAAERERDAAQRQTACLFGPLAEALDALVGYIVALQAGEGAAVAQVDAQMAAGRFLDARERCAAG